MTSESADLIANIDAAIEWGREAHREKDWKKALERWTIGRAAFPERAVFSIRILEALIELGQLESATLFLKEVQDQFPENPETLTLDARLCMLRDDHEDAEVLLQRARHEHPNQPAVWIQSANFAELSGDIALASAYFHEGERQVASPEGMLILHGELLMKNELWSDALAVWSKLKNLCPHLQVGHVGALEAERALKQSGSRRDTPHESGRGSLDKQSIKLTSSSNLKRSLAQNSLAAFLELVWVKALFGMRSEIQRTRLGYIWWFLEPLLYMVVYYLVFAVLMLRGEPDFAPLLLSGIIPWMWFLRTVTAASSSIIIGQSLLNQTSVPALALPVVEILQAFMKQAPVFLLLFVFIIWQGYEPSFRWFLIIPVLLVQLLIGAALGLFIAGLVPLFRDLQRLIPSALTLMMFLSGIFYSYEMIPPDWQSVFLMNPMAFLIKTYRDVLLSTSSPDLFLLSLWFVIGLVSCVLISGVYKRFQHHYPRWLLD